ncbi:MAG: energy-coupling factor ABC transporter ATP-binding protein [Huintestinicola sp.]
MIKFQDLKFMYEGSDQYALDNITLDIEDGDFVGVIGASGAGKSTLTYAINGIVPHHYQGDFYGSVTVNGLDTVDNFPEDIAAHVGSVFQDIDAQMTAAVVEDEILFGLENFGCPKDEIEKRISEALGMLGIEKLRSRNIGTLSGGQKQKVAIAAMLALKPKILVLDEPTGELDPQSSREIFSMLKELNRTLGMTIIIVEQKVMLQCEFADKLLVMDSGKAVFYDKVRNVLTHSKELETMGINVPRIVTLARSLEDRGLYSGEYPISIDEAAEMVRTVTESN